ncbi:MAG TPA: carboxypeptidase-like regulatory domain-containing protein [Thermoanaerobaculia bacterium]|jgi:protocatechuate 3,4-dioxygenase beta subunit|nr:carboxypeptidase-like regulatory domain-containing protein [Thermoanaerobaculia bacterium]
MKPRYRTILLLALLAVSSGALGAQDLVPTSSVSGTVVDEEGQPVAGALVAIGPWKEGYLPACLPARASTSSDGTFRATGFGGDRLCRVKILHPDFAPLAGDLDELPGAVSGVRIVLRRGAVVTGTVVDENGGPVAGAGPVEVELAGLSGDSLGRTTLGADGHFTFAHLPAGTAELRFRRAGAVPFRRPGVQIPAAGTVDLGSIALPRGETLTVRVTDPGERPLAGAAVWITVPDLPMVAWDSRPVVTGADGQALLHGLPPGESLRIDVCHDGSMPERWDLEAVPKEPVQVTLSPAVRLTGTVVDPDGAPVAGASVSVWRNGTPYGSAEALAPSGPCPPGTQQGDLTTDGAGRFTVSPLEPGWYEVEASREDFFRTTLQAVEIPATGRTGLSISLQRNPQRAVPGGASESTADMTDITDIFSTPHTAIPRRAGHAVWIVDPEPEVPAGAQVSGPLRGLEPDEIPWTRVEASMDCGPQPNVEGTVTADGIYHVGPLQEGAWTLRAWIADRETRRKIGLKPDDRQVTADLAFTPVVTVSGRVTGPDGKPVPDATVAFRNENRWTSWARARADGTFDIHLESCTYEVATHTHGFGVEEPARRVVVAGQPVAGLEIRIPAAATLHGRVLGLQPGEIPWLRVEGPDGASLLPGDQDASYSFPFLYPGTWDVTFNVVRRSGLWEKYEQEVTVRDGETDIPLDVKFPVEPAP